jgi:hypothetical protein
MDRRIEHRRIPGDLPARSTHGWILVRTGQPAGCGFLGGSGLDVNDASGYLNDLWRYTP